MPLFKMLQSNFPPSRAPYEQRTWSRSQHFHVPPGQVVRYMWRYDFIYFSIIVSYSPGQVTLGHIKYSWVVFMICWLFQKVRHSSSRALSQAYSSDLTRCHWQKLFWFWGAMHCNAKPNGWYQCFAICFQNLHLCCNNHHLSSGRFLNRTSSPSCQRETPLRRPLEPGDRF